MQQCNSVGRRVSQIRFLIAIGLKYAELLDLGEVPHGLIGQRKKRSIFVEREPTAYRQLKIFHPWFCPATKRQTCPSESRHKDGLDLLLSHLLILGRPPCRRTCCAADDFAGRESCPLKSIARPRSNLTFVVHATETGRAEAEASNLDSKTRPVACARKSSDRIRRYINRTAKTLLYVSS